MRVLDTTVLFPGLGVLTKQPGVLTNDFFVHLLDHSLVWEKAKVCEHFFEGSDRKTGKVIWNATAVDLAFGSNSQLRALAEVYASDDGKAKFRDAFARFRGEAPGPAAADEGVITAEFKIVGTD
jgi:catalase-peroxidase